MPENSNQTLLIKSLSVYMVKPFYIEYHASSLTRRYFYINLMQQLLYLKIAKNLDPLENLHIQFAHNELTKHGRYTHSTHISHFYNNPLKYIL